MTLYKLCYEHTVKREAIIEADDELSATDAWVDDRDVLSDEVVEVGSSFVTACGPVESEPVRRHTTALVELTVEVEVGVLVNDAGEFVSLENDGDTRIAVMEAYNPKRVTLALPGNPIRTIHPDELRYALYLFDQLARDVREGAEKS